MPRISLMLAKEIRTPTMKLLIILAMTAVVALPSCEQSKSDKPQAAGLGVETPTGSKDEPVSLSPSVIAKLEGSIGPEQSRSDQIGSISGTVYNGSEWAVSSIDISFTKTESNESRQFRLRIVEKRRPKESKIGDPFYIYSDVTLEPYSSGEVYVASGVFTDDLNKGDFSWKIVSASGYKP